MPGVDQGLSAPQAPTHRRVGRLVPPLLRQVAFRRYWTGQTISLFGDTVSELALPLVAVLVTGAGAAEMGYLTAAGLLPNLLFSLLAGAWIDRFPHKRHIMIAADLGRAALLASVPAAYLFDLVTLPQLYVVMFAVGTLSVLFECSRSTLFVALVRPDEYISANSLLNGSRAMAYVAGPSTAGLLVSIVTAPLTLLLDAASYLLSAVFLGRIRPVEPAPAASGGLGLGTGLRFIARSPLLRPVLAATTTVNLFNYAFWALAVLYATTELEVPPGLLGAVLGAGAVGGLLGAVGTGRLTARIGIGPALVLGCVLFPAPLILFPAAGGPTPVVLGCLFLAEFGAGFGVMMLDITAGSLQTAAIPDELRARVAGAMRTVNYGIRPLGALLGGALGSWLGVRPTLWIATVGALANVLWLLPGRIPRLRGLAEVTPEEAGRSGTTSLP